MNREPRPKMDGDGVFSVHIWTKDLDDDLGVPRFFETSIYIYIYIWLCQKEMGEFQTHDEAVDLGLFL